MKSFKQFINESIVAYHGSGANFDSFSTYFNGTGIGNAGFGYGVYLTAVKKNAKGWAESLEKTASVLIDGIKPSVEVEKILTSIVNLHGNNSELALIVLKANIDSFYKEKKITKKEYEQIKNSSKLSIIRSRFIYEVVIDGKDFINWNSIITSNQKDKIINQAIEENINININSSMTGEKIYYSIPMQAKEKSEFLFRCGIDGIVFYEYGLNYVIFDTKILKVKKKNSF